MRIRPAACGFVASAAIVLVVSAATPGKYTPPRYRGGVPAPNQVAVTGGGEVFVQVSLDASGGVSAVTPLRATPPFTESVVSAVRRWTFSAAIQEMVPDSDEVPQTVAKKLVASKVFVAALFRPPTLAGGTLGAAPSDVGAASSEMPFALSTTMPAYPPNSMFEGTVLIEGLVTPTGAIKQTRVVQSAGGFESAALAALSSWSFRPARVNGTLTDAYVYVSFGFRPPVGGPSPTGAPPVGPPGTGTATGSRGNSPFAALSRPF
ncbi:MAG TPA: TonB family protein [Vicinamibacterales bacterium]|nr:TonB family protein [Vicinamibacterales bacterium]